VEGYGKYKLSTTSSVVATEVDLINNWMLGTEAHKKSIRPVLLDGTSKVLTFFNARMSKDNGKPD
jgi:hypothetical protein